MNFSPLPRLLALVLLLATAWTAPHRAQAQTAETSTAAAYEGTTSATAEEPKAAAAVTESATPPPDVVEETPPAPEQPRVEVPTEKEATVVEPETAPRDVEAPRTKSKKSGKGSLKQIVKVGERLVIHSGEAVAEIVLIGGKLVVEEGAEVHADTVVIGGEAHIAGSVRGNVVCVAGVGIVAPTAKIDGDFIAIGGSDVQTGAHIGGERVTIGVGGLSAWESLKLFVKETLFKGRVWAPSIGWMWWPIGLALLASLLIAAVLGRSHVKVVDTLTQRPVASLVTGLLVAVALPAVNVVLLGLVVGTLVVPVVTLASWLAMFVGLAAAGTCLGRSLGLRGDTPGSIVLATLLGCALGLALLAVPFVGLPLLVVLVTWSKGAVVLALWEGHQASRPPPPSAGGTVEPSRVNIPPVAPYSVPQPAATSYVPTTEPVAAAGQPAAPQDPTVPPVPQATEPTPPAANAFTSPPPFQGAPPDFRSPPNYGHQAFPPAGKSNAERLAEAESRVGFWPRLGAVVLDLILVAMALGLVSDVLPFVDDLFPLVFVAYTAWLWTWKGTTIGGAVLRLRVQRLDGGTLTFSSALLRVLVSFLSVATLGIGWFWANWNAERQAWQDIVAGTVVVRLRPGVQVF